MILTAKTTFTEFVIAYAQETAELRARFVSEDSEGEKITLKRRVHDDGSSAHRRAIVTGERDWNERALRAGMDLEFRGAVCDMLGNYMQPLL